MSMLTRCPEKEQTRQAGFSLIEAMVAMAIFTIAIIGAYKMQLHSSHSNAIGERVSTATNWGVYELEEILGKDYDDDVFKDYADGVHGTGKSGALGLNDLEANADGVLYVKPDGSKSTTASSSDLYSISWNVAEGTSTETSVLRDVKQVRVHVVRKGGIGSGLLYSHDYYKTEEI